uniref:Uncharacterized protein n=1 Tax=Anguilla anguilla TaxID=7936 RepID=A0A0E9RHZ6_ANGAN
MTFLQKAPSHRIQTEGHLFVLRSWRQKLSNSSLTIYLYSHL